MNDLQFAEDRAKNYALILNLVERGELFWVFGEASIEEIEAENIVGATCLAMKRPWTGLRKRAKVFGRLNRSPRTIFSNTGLSTDEKRCRAGGRSTDEEALYEHIW